jgi:predicted transcriptional regulator
MTDPTYIPDPDGRTLHIRLIGADDDLSADTESIAAQIDAGNIDELELRDPMLRVESVATLGRILRPTNLELLEAIAAHDPESIRATARLVDRGPKEVLQNLDELEDYGLIAYEAHGRAKRPVLPYERIDIQLPFPLSLDADSPVASSGA